VIGVGAWLLGAAAATGVSLLMVSELGHGITAAPGQQLSSSAVNGTQATEAAPLPSSSQKAQSRDGTGDTGAGRSGGGGAGAATRGTVLASSGGTVVARCATAGALLMSWSPQQGFQASSVVRGPATTARVVFTTTASTVTMAVTCPNGVPSAATTVSSAAAAPAAPAPSATGDDHGGGGGGNEGPGGGGGGGDG
jgi:hypothetical protein